MAEFSRLDGRRFSALLFDMDGTILTSIAVGERIWSDWGRKHGLNIPDLLSIIHGVRAIDTVRRLNLPGVDPEAEAAELTAAEMAALDGIAAIEGAVAFLASLPRDRWAIVTSATRDLAHVRLKAAGIAPPRLIVTGEDVVRGKPQPDCFLLAAERLGYDIADCLVFEDAPAGIAAAESAGASVVVVTATHATPVTTPHAEIADYRDLLSDATSAGVRLRRR